MHLRSPSIALLLSVSLLLMGPLMTGARRAMAESQGGQSNTVLFVVSASQAAQDATMLPILIIERGGYKQPVDGSSDAGEIASFADAYYRKGQKYRVLVGGGSAGSLTVKGSTKESECFRTGAEVALQTQAKLNTNVMALATNSTALGQAKGSRRPPTAQERAGVLALAQDVFKQKGVPAALLPSLDVVNLTATDLNGDGREELVGSFVVKKKRANQERYVLFLLAEPDGAGGYKAGLANYERYTEKDIMGGGSIDAIGQTGIYTERFVDQLDLDGDGPSEVITIKLGFEGDGYTIYRKQKGQWQKLYEFSNYRCAF
jgi:hypothetical protein